MQKKIKQGESLFFDGKIKEAKHIFVELLAEYQTNSEILNNLGVIYYLQENVGDAEISFQRALENQEDHCEARLNLSILLENSNRFKEAAGHLERYIETSKETLPNEYYRLGMIYLEMNKTEDARSIFTKCLELDPGQTAIQKALETLENGTGRSSHSHKPTSFKTVSKKIDPTHGVSEENPTPLKGRAVSHVRKSGAMNNPLPMVSVGMPVYNAQATLQRAIDSILSQDFRDFELIISDNASTDETAEICKETVASDKRVRYYRNPVNIGGARNFNNLIPHARGKYFMWAAADDYRKPNMISRSVQELEDDPSVILAYSYTEFIDQASQSIGISKDNYMLEQDDPKERYLSLIAHLDFGNLIYGLHRTSTLASLEGHYYQEFQGFGDAIFLSQVVLKGKVKQIPEILFVREYQPRSGVEQTLARYETHAIDPVNCGITLPYCRGLHVLLEKLRHSGLPLEDIIELTEQTYRIFVERYRALFCMELERAIKLVLEGRFTETWNSSPPPVENEEVQQKIERMYAGITLGRLDEAARMQHDFPGLQLARGICLAMLGRNKEAYSAMSLESQNKSSASESLFNGWLKSSSLSPQDCYG